MKAFYSKIKGENPFYVCPLIKDYASVHLSYTCPLFRKKSKPCFFYKKYKNSDLQGKSDYSTEQT